MKHFFNYLIAALILMCFGCDSSDEKKPSDNFYPLYKGAYQIYDVEEIIYTLGHPDTSHYQLKTVVVDSFQTDDKNYMYVIHRSKRNHGDVTWNYLDTWSAQRDTREVVVKEGNVPYVKLAFPAQTGRTWNGNQYNNVVDPSTNKNEDEYTIEERGLNESDLPPGAFVKVVQEDNEEFVVYFDKRIETYVENVGLAYKETTQLSYCTDNDCLGQQIVESGIRYAQKIVEYGKE